MFINLAEREELMAVLALDIDHLVEQHRVVVQVPSHCSWRRHHPLLLRLSSWLMFPGHDTPTCMALLATHISSCTKVENDLADRLSYGLFDAMHVWVEALFDFAELNRHHVWLHWSFKDLDRTWRRLRRSFRTTITAIFFAKKSFVRRKLHPFRVVPDRWLHTLLKIADSIGAWWRDVARTYRRTLTLYHLHIKLMHFNVSAMWFHLLLQCDGDDAFAKQFP